MKKSKLKVTITDAFEMGKIEGSIFLIKELLELAIVDKNFTVYLKARLKSMEENKKLIGKILSGKNNL